ncbi:MAG: DNA translocase FtsK, partial [Phycisphaeraceae bacterium]|nr:DNA translocase FtsK [Phycisphaeraceae bacterium]
AQVDIGQVVQFAYPGPKDKCLLARLDDGKLIAFGQLCTHLMCPVITEMHRAAAILEWAVTKMEERFELLAEAGVRDINSYNQLSWKALKERFEPSTPEEEAKIPKKIPRMVFVVDELADLMMTNKEVEGFIVRLAQKARAVGIHLILATQRPSANVVTGLIKSNMPCRVSFKVASGMDSRIVLDTKGAELLLGQGDMLLLSPRTSKLTRAQGTLCEDDEVRGVVKFLKSVAEQCFEPQLIQLKTSGGGAAGDDDAADRDPLFEDAVRIVLETRRGSVSLLQRRLAIGYSRSSRLIEQIAEAGIIGEYKGSQAREVNFTLEEWEALKAQAEADAGGAAAPEAAAAIASEPLPDPTEDEDFDEDASDDEAEPEAADDEEDFEEAYDDDEEEDEEDEAYDAEYDDDEEEYEDDEDDEDVEEYEYEYVEEK